MSVFQRVLPSSGKVSFESSAFLQRVVMNFHFRHLNRREMLNRDLRDASGAFVYFHFRLIDRRERLFSRLYFYFRQVIGLREIFDYRLAMLKLYFHFRQA